LVFSSGRSRVGMKPDVIAGNYSPVCPHRILFKRD
jgi:hypothetical protein